VKKNIKSILKNQQRLKLIEEKRLSGPWPSGRPSNQHF
jgi:hypothetical protein